MTMPIVERRSTVMLTKEEFTKTHPELRMGMKVYSKNGEKLGEIEDLTDQGIVIGKGWLLPKLSTTPYDDIMEIRGGRVMLSRESDEMERWRREESVKKEEYRPMERERAGREMEEEVGAHKETGAEPEEVSGEVREEK
jgi:hypothetical protein